MIEVVHKNIEDDVGDGFDDLAIRKTAVARVLEVCIGYFAALDDDAAGELQDGVCFAVSGTRTNGICDRRLSESNPAAHKDVCV